MTRAGTLRLWTALCAVALTAVWPLDNVRPTDGFDILVLGALKDLPVAVTHIKYALTREQAQGDLGVRFIFPEQGTRWHFK